jgi:hypothetical protein
MTTSYDPDWGAYKTLDAETRRSDASFLNMSNQLLFNGLRARQTIITATIGNRVAAAVSMQCRDRANSADSKNAAQTSP